MPISTKALNMAKERFGARSVGLRALETRARVDGDCVAVSYAGVYDDLARLFA